MIDQRLLIRRTARGRENVDDMIRLVGGESRGREKGWHLS